MPAIILSKRARDELLALQRWSREQECEALFNDELRRTFALLEACPAVGAPVPQVAPFVRRWHMRRLHYFLFYRVEPDHLMVLALWHTSRGDIRL